MELIRKLKYLYLKKHRWLDPYLQDLISSKTMFKPYNIKLIEASKTNKNINEFNYFKFSYNALTYELLNDNLNIIAE